MACDVKNITVLHMQCIAINGHVKKSIKIRFLSNEEKLTAHLPALEVSWQPGVRAPRWSKCSRFSSCWLERVVSRGWTLFQVRLSAQRRRRLLLYPGWTIRPAGCRLLFVLKMHHRNSVYVGLKIKDNESNETTVCECSTLLSPVMCALGFWLGGKFG